MKIAIMIALITVLPTDKKQEVDALAFKTLATCNQAIEPIKKELLKTIAKVQLDCVESDLY